MLDSAELQAELKARFDFPGVQWFWEMPILGIDYSAAVPILTYWLGRIGNEDVKVVIAELLAFPEYGAAARIAEALRAVAAKAPDPSQATLHDLYLQRLSQHLISATAKDDRGSFYQFASDPSLPDSSRFFFLEAMAKAKDRRAIPLLQAMIESDRTAGWVGNLLRMLEKFNPDGFQSLVESFRDHQDKDVRDIVAKIRIRLAKNALKEIGKSRPDPP